MHAMCAIVNVKGILTKDKLINWLFIFQRLLIKTNFVFKQQALSMPTG
jgi:hypothetical protein